MAYEYECDLGINTVANFQHYLHCCSTKNLEKRLLAMSNYAKDLEVKIGGTGNSKFKSVVLEATKKEDEEGGGLGSPGATAWQKHTKALQQLFDVEKT